MNRETNYPMASYRIAAKTQGIPHETANLANAAALLWEYMDGINWVGFYKMTDGQLVLGPFQGKAACVEIAVGKGVCGTAVAQDKTQLVYDVHQFPGHIACDGASNSEIVIPLHAGNKIWGVLDIDSPHIGRFTEADQEALQKIAAIIEGFLAP